MHSEAVALWTETSSDPELIAGVRAGDSAAFGVLYERHVAAARKVASQYTNTVTDIDDVVSESFSRVLRALQRGDGPDLAFRAYLFTIVRRTGLDIIQKGIRTKPRDDMSPYESALGHEPGSDEPALDGFEHGMVADAFKSLPERWQAVLWYTEVEKKTPKEIAPLLGLSANGVAALAYRAREALRQAYLQQHLNTSDSVECLETNTLLGSYVRGGLAKREHSRVDVHVQGCERCTALVAELTDVNRGMRAVIGPLFMGALGVGALEGGLAIGGVFGSGGGAAAVTTAAGTAATTTTATATPTVHTTTSGAGGTTAASTSGVGMASGAGTAGTTAGSAGFAGFIGAVSHLALPAAAVVGVTAIALNGASILGWFAPGTDADDNTAAQIAPTESPVSDEEAQNDSATDDAPGVPTPAPTPEAEQEAADAAADDTFAPSNQDSANNPASRGYTPARGASAGSGTSNNGTVPPTTVTPRPGIGSGGGAPSPQVPGPGPGPGPGTPGPGTPGTGTPEPEVPGPSEPGPGEPVPGGPGDGDGGEPEPGEPGAEEPGDSEPGDGEPGDGQPNPGEPDPSPVIPGTAKLAIGKAPLEFLEVSRTTPTVSMALANEGDGAAESVIAQVTLPEGLTIASPVSGGGGMATASTERINAYLAYVSDRTFMQDYWECETNSAGSVATCTLDELEADAMATLTLAVDIDTDELGEDSFTTFDVRAGDVSSTYAVRTALAPSNGDSNPLDPGYMDSGGLAVAHFGGTVMGCHATPLQLHATNACRATMSDTTTDSGRQLENNHWNMVQINDHGGVANSGLSTISLPEGVSVKAAYLEWSANRHLYRSPASPGDSWTQDLDSARIKIGAGEFTTVHADTVEDDVVEENRQYYVARANITDMLSGITDTTVTVADIAVAAGPHTDPVRTYYGGFTLTIVYEDPDVPEGTTVTLFEGPHWVKSATPVTIRFPADSGTRVTPSWTAYEGDRGNTGDRVMLGGDNFVPYVLWTDGTFKSRNSGDAADSWANGSFWTNTMGIDAHGFSGKLLNSSGTHSVRISTNGDNFMIGTFAVTLTPPATSGEG